MGQIGKKDKMWEKWEFFFPMEKLDTELLSPAFVYLIFPFKTEKLPKCRTRKLKKLNSFVLPHVR